MPPWRGTLRACEWIEGWRERELSGSLVALGNLAKFTAISFSPHFGSSDSPRRRFLRRLSPFPFAGVPVVASDAPLDHFVAPLIARHDEGSEVAAAIAKRAERHHKDDLQ